VSQDRLGYWASFRLSEAVLGTKNSSWPYHKMSPTFSGAERDSASGSALGGIISFIRGSVAAVSTAVMAADTTASNLQ